MLAQSGLFSLLGDCGGYFSCGVDIILRKGGFGRFAVCMLVLGLILLFLGVSCGNGVFGCFAGIWCFLVGFDLAVFRCFVC